MAKTAEEPKDDGKEIMHVLEVQKDIGIKKKIIYSEQNSLRENESEDIILDYSNVKRVDLSIVQVILYAGVKLKKEKKLSAVISHII